MSHVNTQITLKNIDDIKLAKKGKNPSPIAPPLETKLQEKSLKSMKRTSYYYFTLLSIIL